MKTTLIALLIVAFALMGLSNCGKNNGNDNAKDGDANDDAEDDDSGQGDDDDDDDTDDDDDDDYDYDDDDDFVEEAWTDPATGLTWEARVRTEYKNYSDAVSHCLALTYAGYSDWRLPTIGELRSLIRGCEKTETDGLCPVADDCLELACRTDDCLGCNFLEGPAEGCYWPGNLTGKCDSYWSISMVTEWIEESWEIFFKEANIEFVPNYDNVVIGLARCVR